MLKGLLAEAEDLRGPHQRDPGPVGRALWAEKTFPRAPEEQYLPQKQEIDASLRRREERRRRSFSA